MTQPQKVSSIFIIRILHWKWFPTLEIVFPILNTHSKCFFPADIDVSITNIYSKSRVPKPHFCWFPHSNEGNVGKQTSPPLPMVRKGTDCECLLPVPLPFRIARLHCTLLLEPKILRWSTSYWIMVLLQMLLIRSINLCFLVCRKLACKAGVFCFDIDLDFRLTVSWGESKKDSKGVVDAFPPCLILFHVLLGRANKTKKHACSAG